MDLFVLVCTMNVCNEWVYTSFRENKFERGGTSPLKDIVNVPKREVYTTQQHV